MAHERLPAHERRAQIAEAALALLAEGGAQRLTAVALAEQVGLKDASLFRHFESMAAIFSAAVDLFEAWLEQSLREGLAHDDPLESLHAFFVHRLALLRGHPEVLQLAFQPRLLEDAAPRDAERVRATVARTAKFLVTRLAAAQEAGQVRRDLPAEVLRWTVTGAMRGAAQATPTLLEEALGPGGSAPEAAWRAVACLLEPADGRGPGGTGRMEGAHEPRS